MTKPTPRNPASDSADTNGRSEHRARLLVVDDSESARSMICRHMEQEQFDYEEAENGAIAVEKARSTRFDLILMDIQMPMMDGHEAMRRIRQWEESHALNRTPIIAFTASSFEEDVQRAIENGADLHVCKPVRKDALAAAIKTLLRGESLRDNVRQKHTA